jgi:GNAT superfamily N-acetyltransferase
MADIRLLHESELNLVLELCNQNMEYDSLTETLLREKLYDDPDFNSELTLTYWENNKPVGFMNGVIRNVRGGKTGFIKLMVVDKAWRRKGIARKMYQALEKKFKQQNVSKVRVYDVPFNYLMPGIDPRYTAALSFVDSLGFKRFGDTVNMIVSLSGQDFNTEEQEKKLVKDNIIISRAGYDDAEDMLTFIDENFALWHPEVENMYNSIPVSLHIARYNGIIKAFSGHNGNNFGTGWFGPMGTHPDLRGKGIGSILLKRCLQDIKDWGLERSVIPWVGPIRFYSHYVNAVVDRVFWRYEKNL